ncbi:MAG TPA: sigma-70 family RNA polymerase sigma factor [Solirubrobacteraceae bacterium]|nr:sigma-70 family RNA polymerase sigma factor [Solirubrobacteraceae bacterium]
MNPRLLPSATVARSVLRTQSDSRLTELARAGSEPAFEAIVARYRRSLVRYCARLVGEGDAEEAVQEALLKAHAALLAGDPVRRLAPWLHVVAHNAAISHLRARSSRPQPADADYQACPAVDGSTDYRQELGDVLDAVRSLPERQRDAIVMRELEGRSYEEIAAHLGSSHGAVRQLLHRARSSLRERVAALLPLEPLARWALSGAGGAGAAGGAGLSGACVLGAKACAALLVPATVALVASAPATPPKTTRVKPARPAVAASQTGTTAASGRETAVVARRPVATIRVASVTTSARLTSPTFTTDPGSTVTRTTITPSATRVSSPSRTEAPRPAAPTQPGSPSAGTQTTPVRVVMAREQHPAVGAPGFSPAPTASRPASPSSSPPAPAGGQPMQAAVATPVR